MRLLRPFAAVTALLAVAVALPAHARVARPVELTETTVITASHSGYVDVVLPVDARLSPRSSGNPDVQIEGRGRFVGVWLERTSEDYRASQDTLESTRMPSFLGAAQTTYGSAYPASTCRSVPNDTVPVTQDCTTSPPAQSILLHEGRYRLRVLADDSPLTITLSLHGLDAGTTSVTPAHRLASTEKSLVQRETAQDKVVTFGGSVPVFPANYAWILSAAKGRGTGTLDGVSSCSRSDTSEPAPFAFGPACPGGDGSFSQYTVHAGGQTYGHFASYSGNLAPLDATTMGLGGSFSGDNGRTFVAGLGVWMQVPS